MPVIRLAEQESRDSANSQIAISLPPSPGLPAQCWDKIRIVRRTGMSCRSIRIYPEHASRYFRALHLKRTHLAERNGRNLRPFLKQQLELAEDHERNLAFYRRINKPPVFGSVIAAK